MNIAPEELVRRYMSGESARSIVRDLRTSNERLRRILVSHGVTIRAIRKHGESKSTEYAIWQGMLERCYKPTTRGFHRYGGRGITVCDRWRRSFENFLADMGRRPSLKHSLDRYPNNNGNYEPGNCRWATTKEQANNKRTSRLLTAHGETMTLALWAERLGVHWNAIDERLRKGWSVEDAVSLPRTDSRRPLGPGAHRSKCPCERCRRERSSAQRRNRHEKRARGLCWNCKAPAEPGRSTCAAHRFRGRRDHAAAATAARLRHEAIVAPAGGGGWA